jgi:poly-beta-1,6-N-acetyl-D-glucosamine synthase
MPVWKTIFWISLALVFYNYLGYAFVIALSNFFRGKKKTPPVQQYPTVSFIVAAYNEEDCIESKILNSLDQDYPSDRIEFLFITDGSTDNTNQIILRYPQIHLLFEPHRAGKSAALNRVVAAASNEILVFCDANTMLNPDAIRNITRHYSDPLVGGVAGEKKVIAATGNSDEVGAGEGLYWKYESLLKKLDSGFYSVVGAAGELFSLRKSLYEPVGAHVVLDDFIISMKVAQKGFRVVYEPDAFAMELPSFSMGDEQKRKVRIAAGGFQAMTLLPSLFAFWKQPKLSFLYLSHRVMRWTVSPVCLVLAFVANAILFFQPGTVFYKMLFTCQVLFYGMAILAAVFSLKSNKLKPLKLAYYFVFMNLSVVQGFFRFLRGRQPAAWEKARRSQATVSAGENP